MVAIPELNPIDPTLAAVDRALEERAARQPPRPYLGMSEIGHPCARALWYRFHWVAPAQWSAEALKRFDDGHHGEDLMADRLRLVAGITLLTRDSHTGRQWAFADHDGHLRGHLDGIILGLLQASKAWHLWEHKVVNDKKLTELERLKSQVGEKNALRQWDYQYYAQAVAYMRYAGLDRHYLTASSPGGRRTVSCRTNADPAEAGVVIGRARRIIDSHSPPARISNDPDSAIGCRHCEHREVCHFDAAVAVYCRTCRHSSPAENGAWHCARWDKTLSVDEQRQGCHAHLDISSLVPGEEIDADPEGMWVDYEMPDGRVWRNEVAGS
jgi:hypothetical protein